MALRLISLTLNTPNLADQVQFYSSIGFQMDRVQVRKGTEMFRAKSDQNLAGFEINLFGLMEKHQTDNPSLQISFSVTDLEEVFQKVTSISSVTTLMDPTDMPEGRKAIVKDPDGNSVEILQIKQESF